MITIKRKEITRYGVPKEFKDEKKANLGSYTDENGNTSRPLSFKEEDRIMPDILNLDSKDTGFRKLVETYYKNLTLRVLTQGINLEIGMDEEGNPLNSEDFIKYRFALKHPWTGKNKEEVDANEHLQFWIEDSEAEDKKKSISLESSTKAFVEFAKLVEDDEKMDWVLRTVLSKYPELGSLKDLVELKPDKKKLKISEVITKDPSYFLEVMSDKDLSYRAEIASMAASGVLRKEGNKYLNGTENLGSIEGTIAWCKDANNSEEYAILKARLSEFGSPVPTKAKTKTK